MKQITFYIFFRARDVGLRKNFLNLMHFLEYKNCIQRFGKSADINHHIIFQLNRFERTARAEQGHAQPQLRLRITNFDIGHCNENSPFG